ncbi:MAG: nucleotidyltransferase family protein [Omnitrophica WOR_2 bacterium]
MIAAIVLAAGQSRRMGRPKMTLPWGTTTVIGQVVSVLAEAGLQEILVVTGGARQDIEEAIRRLPARAIYNPDYSQGEMLSTFQTGLSALGEDCKAALVVLGDQPQIQVEVVRMVIRAYQETRAALVVPSYQMRRGHPWLLDRSLWPQALGLKNPETLKDLLKRNSDQIHYLLVETDTILQDIDTPEDYRRFYPEGSTNR